MTRILLTSLFILIALVLGSVFYLSLENPSSWTDYFKLSYISQFGPLTICIELLVAGIYLGLKHEKTNFVLAIFGFTVILDMLFNLTGIFLSRVPLYASIIFGICAVMALYLSFTNSFNLGKISILGTFVSFILGLLIELFFNYWYALV